MDLAPLVLDTLARDGEDAALACILVALDAMPLAERRDHLPLLAIVPGRGALDWLEAHIESPVVLAWGKAAALLGIDWPRLATWMARGRPHSLAALDALVTCARPDARHGALLCAVQPRLIAPPALDELHRTLASLRAQDPSPRVSKTIDEILDRADEILCTAPSPGVSVRAFYARDVAEEGARRARWRDKLANVPQREAASRDEQLRPAVQRLVALGAFPPESSAAEEEVAHLDALLASIDTPPTRAEATALLSCFGPDELYGVAWRLLHLLESTPGGAPLDRTPSPAANGWLRLLWDRAHR